MPIRLILLGRTVYFPSQLGTIYVVDTSNVSPGCKRMPLTVSVVPKQGSVTTTLVAPGIGMGTIVVAQPGGIGWLVGKIVKKMLVTTQSSKEISLLIMVP